ncbi:L-aspartate oxidase [Alkalihalobacterium chitinilyticum]|uniref:L-aspartate oxidase n=1 Tax=Alkalihalobacterium chitinilyticum TaxID=2980103 RepID=A0ABT5VHT1_9BACI|nr:L-aspartate oxidase [Alkalihalobacterium chitinilyticum]MDE5415010.1 L-aspartate oxidase [Alkalihalobacterium chitinilyticum]
MKVFTSDVIIIGSGIAGLMAAELLSFDKNVILITKSDVVSSNSIMAQGGIAAVVDKEDDWRDHFLDTIRAGCYYNCEDVTELLVRQGAKMIEKLKEIGVQFDKGKDGKYLLGQEGAHLKRRILHAGGDATGKELITKLISRVKQNVTIHDHMDAIDLIIENGRCNGVICIDEDQHYVQYFAPHVVLATGGAGQLYSVTSNDMSITGDGMALAYRAGARLADMEFVQFHPTMLVKNGKGAGLVSEAVRGEGGRLITEGGNLLMEGKHELGDLAPRDVVAREIYEKAANHQKVYLDIRPIKDFKQKFPSVTSLCTKAGIKLEEGLIPIAPGAHFVMGGVETTSFGKTTVEGLYAVGEVANTGVHGANRLASNSLLEGVVFANELARAIIHSDESIMKTNIKPIAIMDKKYPQPLPTQAEVQAVMSKYVGIVRTKDNLVKALKWFEKYQEFIQSNRRYILSGEQHTVRNMLTVGYLMTASALCRKESRGSHFRLDYPLASNRWLNQTVCCSISKQQPYVRNKKDYVRNFVI